jgi:L1 cell adhesion molecule like protein
VFEGERALTKDNTSLGKFLLEDIPAMPRGVPQIEVVFDLDANGILNVSASEKSTGKSNKITITNDKGRLSKEEIERMVAESEKYKDADLLIKERVEAKNQLEGSLYQSRTMENVKEEDKIRIQEKVKETQEWLDAHPTETKEVYEEKQKEFNEFSMSILAGTVPTEPKVEPTIEEID